MNFSVEYIEHVRPRSVRPADTEYKQDERLLRKSRGQGARLPYENCWGWSSEGLNQTPVGGQPGRDSSFIWHDKDTT